MSRLSYERHCAEIRVQTDLLRSTIAGGDMTVDVPSCPGWNVGQLVRHLGGGQRWLEELVRTRSTEFIPDDAFRDLSPYADEDPAVLEPWLAESGARLSDTLLAAGPEAKVWTPLPVDGTRFFARRFCHETLMHRADATLALGAPFTVAPDVAADALDEWMELGSLPVMFDFHPEQRELLGAGRTIGLAATDVDAHWLVDLTGELIRWRPAREEAAVAVHGSLTDLLLVTYKRRPVNGGGVEVVGDRELLDFWLERVSFG
jgi:uncharacterized protein (TIGR03083 family)